MSLLMVIFILIWLKTFNKLTYLVLIVLINKLSVQNVVLLRLDRVQLIAYLYS